MKAFKEASIPLPNKPPPHKTHTHTPKKKEKELFRKGNYLKFKFQK